MSENKEEVQLVALKAYVAEIDPKRCCSIERGPARDKFGVFAVLRMDGALTLRSWDRESGRWY
jgi:hypothetical protein